MSWIESHQSLWRHPKTYRLASELVIDRVTAVGHLHCIWWWALDYAQSGDLSDYAPCVLASAGEWNGDPEAFVGALVAARFVDVEPLRLHDWMDYAGRLIETRERDRRRKAEARRGVSGGRPPEIQRTADVPTNQPTNQPDTTYPTCEDGQKSSELDEPKGASFGEYWSLYPKKTEIKLARTRWSHLSAAKRTAALAGARVVADAVSSGAVAVQFVPGGAVFLNERWPEWLDGIPAHYTSSRRNGQVSSSDLEAARALLHPAEPLQIGGGHER